MKPYEPKPKDTKLFMGAPPDSRDEPPQPAWARAPRCSWCGREVREDWTPEAAEEPLCARCRDMVRDE